MSTCKVSVFLSVWAGSFVPVFCPMPPVTWRKCNSGESTAWRLSCVKMIGQKRVAIKICCACMQDAHESFTDWFEHCHSARPTLPNIALRATFSECIAYEHKQRQFEQELDRWQHSLDLQTKVTFVHDGCCYVCSSVLCVNIASKRT